MSVRRNSRHKPAGISATKSYTRLIVLLILFLFSLVPCRRISASASDIPPVIIDYFYEPGCPDCIRVRDQIMPELKERFEGFYKLNRYDVGTKADVIKLITYQEKLGITKNEPVCMVVDYQYVFNGFSAIKKDLFGQIDECVAERLEPGWNPPEPIVVEQVTEDAISLVEKRLKHFTVSTIVVAGLVDGINPCAIATLVFFMSLLVVSRVKGRGLIEMGISFCLASFVTYTAMGFGLLHLLDLFVGFETLQLGVEIVMIAVLCIFAYLSFRDAYRYGRSGNPNEVTLQIPQEIKKKIHEIMHTGLGRRSLILGGLFIGVVVTALESVCTGQVYVPTLVLVVKTTFNTFSAGGRSILEGLIYLLLYNTMFIVPLVAVFLLTYQGLKTETFIEWSKKNVVPSKILLGIFFLALAVLIRMV